MNIIFSVLIISAIFSIFFNKIIKKINIYDHPDGIRKFQKNKIPCVGGIYFYIIFFLIFLYFLFFSNLDFFFKIFLFQTKKELILFFICATCLFLIGLYDDKYQMESKIKTLILLSIIFFFVYHVERFQISEIRSSIINYEITLGNLSIFFTTICIFSFLVASNMFDGSNGQSFINFLSILMFLFYKSLFTELSLFLIMILSFFAIYNFKNLAYLGDNGVYFFSFILAYLIVTNYNQDKTIYVEEIVVILIIPIIDMIRLFINRAFLGKNPFLPDATHLHHIIKKKLGEKKLIYILFFLFFVPLLFLIFVKINYYLIITFQFLIYIYLTFINKIYQTK